MRRDAPELRLRAAGGHRREVRGDGRRRCVDPLRHPRVVKVPSGRMPLPRRAPHPRRARQPRHPPRFGGLRDGRGDARVLRRRHPRRVRRRQAR